MGADHRLPAASDSPRSDPLDPERRRNLMSRVRTHDTAPELRLRRALWQTGLRGWRVHPKGVYGKPDLAWIGLRLAVFVDGAFWHGHPDVYHGQSGPFWDEKIARNRARDAAVNARLADEGWTVLRFWDFDVEREPEKCSAAVQTALATLRADAS
jgi:DNA mismatch endonuclease, patch repair protein